MSERTLLEPLTFDIPIEIAPQLAQEAPTAPGPKAYKNIEMDRMLGELAPFLDRTDKIGYAAARNTRILRSETAEYFARREQLIMKYGEEELDEDGSPTGQTMLRFDSPAFREYAKEIEEWANIEHAPNLFIIPAREVVGKLSGNEILSIEWMLDWDDAGDEPASEG